MKSFLPKKHNFLPILSQYLLKKTNFGQNIAFLA